MRAALCMFLVLAVGCSSAVPPQAKKRTLPEPLVAAKLPERPDAKPIPPKDNWTVAVAAGDVVPINRGGILLSLEKGARASRYIISYNELRGLYEIDLRTWGRERKIYERHLTMSEAETARWREKAKRTWWENHDGQFGLIGGVLVGAAITVAIVGAVEGVK